MQENKRHWPRDGFEGVFVCAIIVGLLLFLNNAGVVSITEFWTPGSVIAMTFGWPFIMGAALAGLSAMDSGGSATAAIAYVIGGVVLNILYAFGLGVLVGWAARKIRG